VSNIRLVLADLDADLDPLPEDVDVALFKERGTNLVNAIVAVASGGNPKLAAKLLRRLARFSNEPSAPHNVMLLGFYLSAFAGGYSRGRADMATDATDILKPLIDNAPKPSLN